MNDRTRSNADQLVVELQQALAAAMAAAADQTAGLERVRASRRAFLIALAKLLEPALDVLIDKGSNVVAIGRSGLFLGRGPAWFRFSDQHAGVYMLTNEALGDERVDPAEIVRGVNATLRSHAYGRTRSGEELQAESRKFDALLALIEA